MCDIFSWIKSAKYFNLRGDMMTSSFQEKPSDFRVESDWEGYNSKGREIKEIIQVRDVGCVN